jgi:hypothetical protein
MELADSKKLLGGTGKLHRHVKLKSKSDWRLPLRGLFSKPR